MKSLFRAFVMIMLVASATSVSAQNFGHEMPTCLMTPTAKRENYPGADKIVTSESLAQPAGKSMTAPGQPLLIYGRVYTSECVPLMGARVDIWQADTNGNIIYPDKGQFATPYPLFAGSGQAFTDNEGKFTFFTIFPGTKMQKIGGKEFESAPHINIRITAEQLKRPFDTVMYFANDRRNAVDPSLNRLKEELRPLLMATVQPINAQFPNVGLNAYFDITLPVKDPFHKY